MQLFYNPDIAANAQEAKFPKDESKHIVKVLRKREGDILDITNGSGNFFKAEITQASPSNCKVKILEVTTEKPFDYHLHMAVAPTKLNDRYEYFLEKATEIGISEITPIICDHSERKVIKEDRYERILQSAMKQSLKAYIPKLNPAVSFSEFIEAQKNTETERFIAHCEETDRFSLKQKLKPKMDVLILIGPEGDFSTTEIELALKSGFLPVMLGEQRLRTETAAVVATHSVAFVNEV
ncbi:MULTISPECIES: 16S rRNA (uracil(1498)-N(3))-methyltransferase [unclassified Leeuwenhoekiella]|uniref:16S rRNA (uracil(1498)-N(3))-methyltransferase n=1 Tax=unclassified Leeuwenhoekiella TaxID=2615029 RepID=UPI000C35835D|nr:MULTISPECIES: 16S rRNA (uracil(1498)-N(3))-methyltransferase [unclassified Leeuwenhoekiella]MAW94021.1 16S rRNA (uracil(1498)-N(3))-methyltransferase [Leeuwenhoekiella sp.]MBA80940.1 16S rRNA (uracil(1498)-N(3))-methyltransferase [Leeuwenhoekiella sp.]|tara:strand:- start:3355 stop:4068 length:714 start_codon:yes stop_codon:yes gene_type:complete